jgi:phage terminase large subunit
VFDCYENSGEGIEHYCKIVKDKFPKERYHIHYVPHDAANKLQAAGGRSILEQMKAFDIGPMLCVPATSHENAIEALRMTLPKCWFNASACHNGLEALRMYRYAYDEVNRTFKTKPLHDWSSHFADAAELMAVMWRKKPLTTAQLKSARIEQNFKALRSSVNLDKLDPYRLKPGMSKRR